MPNDNKDFNIGQLIYEVNKDNSDSSDKKTTSKGSNSKSYKDVLGTIRELLSTNHATELANIVEDKNAEKHIKGIITKYITDHNISVDTIDSVDKLVDTLYESMAGFDFLTQYIYDEDYEEINGNAWNDIEVVTPQGWYKIDTHFHSPQHSIDIVQKMMRLGGVIIDGQRPIGDSYITQGVRISAIIPPCVDDATGAVFSIRKQNNKCFTREQLIEWGTATGEMLDFLSMCIKNGISIGIAGSTGSGKTTDISYLLNQLPDDKRIFTIEDSREFSNVIRFDSNGKVLNRVIHTKTRPNEERKEYNIDANKLLKSSLRFHPDVIVPAEMRGEEAMTAQEAGRTGHTVLTSLHASTALAAYTRILTMAMMSGTHLSEDLMLKLIIEAFPIMAFKYQLKDMTRKYMKIVEAEDYRNGKIIGRTLFKFVVTGNEMDETGNKIKKVCGYHKKMKSVSNRLANRLLENGADISIIKKFADPKWDPEILEEGDEDL
jgi:pilus assembly protein CpaF